MASDLRRRVRQALFVALAAFLAVYVLWAARKYLSGATGVNARMTDRSAFAFPAVSVCGQVGWPPRTPTDGTWVARAAHTVNINGTRHDFLDVSPNSTFLPLLGISPSDLWENRLETLDFASFLCNIYKAPEGATTPFRGANTVMSLQLRSPGDGARHFNIYVGHRGGLSTSASFGSVLLLARGDESERVNFFSYSVGFRRTTNLRKDYWKCRLEGEAGVSQQKCLDDYMAARHPCYVSLTKGNASSCNATEITAIVDLKSTLESGGVSKFMDTTGCVPPCTIDLQDVDLRNSFSLPRSEVGDQVVGPEHKDEVAVVIYFFLANPILTVQEEYWVYDGHSLIGDVGGMIGMLLGTSVLVVFDACADAVCKLRKITEAGRQKSSGNK